MDFGVPGRVRARVLHSAAAGTETISADVERGATLPTERTVEQCSGTESTKCGGPSARPRTSVAQHGAGTKSLSGKVPTITLSPLRLS